MQRRHTRHGLANEVIDECVAYRVGQGTGIVKALLVVVFTFYKTIDGAARR